MTVFRLSPAQGLAVAAVLAAVAGLVSFAWFGDRGTDRPPAEGAMAAFTPTRPPAPIQDFAFRDASGAQMRLADFRGKAILVNLWATWCPPCVREMPALNRLQAALGGDRFEVVALQTLDPKGIAAVAPFYARIGAEALAVYSDPEAQATRVFDVPGLPATILIDAAGRERGRLLGPAEWDAPEALALIRSYLSAADGSAQP